MKGSDAGLVGDIVVEIMGAFVGGLLIGAIAPGNSAGFIGTIIVAFIGAILLIGFPRMRSGGSPGSKHQLAAMNAGPGPVSDKHK